MNDIAITNYFVFKVSSDAYSSEMHNDLDETKDQ